MRVENKKYNNTLHDAGYKKGNATIQIVTDEETVRIPLPDGLPEYVCLPKAKQLSGATVRTNGSGDVLYSIYPTNKSHVVRFKKFTAKDGELPAPRMVEGRDIKMGDGRKFFKPEHLEFTVIFEILSGDWQGAEIPYFLEYCFAKDRDGTAYVNGSEKVNKKIITWLEMCGFDPAQETIKYKENLLPDLEQILAERAEDHPFMVSMEKGYVKSLSDLPAGMSVGAVGDEDEDEEPAPRRKPAKDENENPFEEPKKPAKRRVVEPEPEDEDEEDDDEPPARPATGKRKVWRDE